MSDMGGHSRHFERATLASGLPPANGHQPTGPFGPVRADCVEKVLSGIGTNFLRAAGALGILGRGGPLRLEQIHSAAFPHTLRGHCQPKSTIGSPLREFC